MGVRPALGRALLIAGVLAAAGYLGYVALFQRRAFSPGPLHAAHAAWEQECDQCHEGFGAAVSAKCAACHVDGQGNPLALKGFKKHHTDASLDCLACHTDHKGERGETTTQTLAAYQASCEQCHADYAKQKGPFQGVLVWDHKDHTTKQGLKCEQCHDARPDERAHHGQTLIARPDCFNVGCHTEALKKPKDFQLASVSAKHAPWKDDCFACHTWLGKIDSGKCASCHEDGKGGALALKGFASHHSSRDLDCARCHTEHKGETGNTTIETQQDYAAHCVDCHAGFAERTHTVKGEVFLHTQHGDKQKLACDACHDVKKDATVHGKVTLEENACVACHMKRDHPQKPVLAQPWKEVSASHAPWEKDCARCHAAAGDTRGSLCADCHKTPDGKEVVAFTGFKKHHLDPTLDCAACHTEHKGRTPPPPTIAQEPYTRQCILCHANYAQFEGKVDGHPFSHKGHTLERGMKCDQCHDANPALTGTAHGQMTLKTDSCTTCHLRRNDDGSFKKPLEEPVGALAKGHEALTDCASCHTNWHAADDNLCRTCHVEEAKRLAATSLEAPVTPGISRPAGPQKLFPTHATETSLACQTCHTDHRGQVATDRMPKETKTATCVRCHALPGGGTYVQTVERSPRRVPADDPLIGKPRDDTFAHSQHTSLACERCHDGDVKRHARRPGDKDLPLTLKTGECIACHHAPETIAKKDCESCHATEARFRGGAAPGMTAMAPADAHVGLVKCAECHLRDDSTGYLRTTRDACVRCHGEDFGDLYDSTRAALAGAIDASTPPDIAAAVRRFGMHNPALARAALSHDRPGH